MWVNLYTYCTVFSHLIHNFQVCYTVVSGFLSFLTCQGGSVLFPLLFILYTSNLFKLVVNRLFAYAVDFTILAAVCKPVDRPAVAASLRRPYQWKIYFFIICFYAIMHRTTIVQNKIISIIYSCLFYVQLFIGLV